jgi:hypothetical protein
MRGNLRIGQHQEALYIGDRKIKKWDIGTYMR